MPLSLVSRKIWSVQELNVLPKVNSLLFGGFLVSDVCLEDDYSYIDIIFGSNRASSGFAGVHRVSISGSRLEYAYLSCNPSVNKALKPDFLQVLHKVYAMLLFREGVAKVLEGDSGM